MGVPVVQVGQVRMGVPHRHVPDFAETTEEERGTTGLSAAAYRWLLDRHRSAVDD